jgi:hypothetical protein
LHAALLLSGKWWCQGQLNAVVPGELLHLSDELSGRRFLVDTGASYSIFPYVSLEQATGPFLMAQVARTFPVGEKDGLWCLLLAPDLSGTLFWLKWILPLSVQIF